MRACVYGNQRNGQDAFFYVQDVQHYINGISQSETHCKGRDQHAVLGNLMFKNVGWWVFFLF